MLFLRFCCGFIFIYFCGFLNRTIFINACTLNIIDISNLQLKYLCNNLKDKHHYRNVVVFVVMVCYIYLLVFC